MENQSPSIIAIGAVVAIVLGFVMGVRPAIEYPEGKGQQSMQSSALATGTPVVGGPSLSTTHSNAILTHIESPVAGSQHYGIDNAYALANDGNCKSSSHSASVESDVSTRRTV